MVKNTKTKKGSITKVKYNRFLYYTVNLLLLIYARIRLKLRINRKSIDFKKGPYLVLANHACPVDFLIFSGLFYPHLINYTVAENMSYRPTYRWFINNFGAIKRHQYAADFKSIKTIKNNLDAGISVLLFPEGRVSADGKTGYIPTSIAKLIKFLKYPVVIGRTSGCYICNPKWNEKQYYRGGINLNAKVALTTEDIEKTSLRDIYSTIKTELAHNDHLYQEQTGYKIRGHHRAEGLYLLCYKCPICNTVGKMNTKGNYLVCENCGHKVEYTSAGKLISVSGKNVPHRIDLWYDYQREEVRKDVQKEDFCYSYDIDLHRVNGKTNFFEKTGSGMMTINRKGLTFDGTSDGGAVSIFMESKDLPVVSFRLGDYIDIYYESEIIRFFFREGNKLSTQASLAIEEVYKFNYGLPDDIKQLPE